MTLRSETGKFGEDMASRYLLKKGYKIIERNYRKPWGELDIISIAPDRTLVFVEVKTVRSSGVDNLSISAEDQLTKAKLTKLKRTCSLYAGSSTDIVDDEAGWRIDLLALTITQKDCLVRHYENIA
ncbi:MAG: YraN family protein [Candidatus Colwellbacteria bacterium]|nr:YraN family protein [Candidatus Colwellbacteria bacterium]